MAADGAASSSSAIAASGSVTDAAASVATSSTSCRTSSTSTAPSVSASSSSSSRTSSSTVASSSSSSASSASDSASSMISWTAVCCCSRSAAVSSARSASFAAARAEMSSFSFFSRISASLASRSSSTRRFASARVASGSASGSRKNLSTFSCASSHCAVARAAAAAGSEVDTFPLGESAARTSALASSAAASRLRCGTHRAMRTRRSLPPQRYPPTEGFISTRREPVDAATRAGDLARDVDASPRLCCALQDAEGAGNDTRNATEDIRLTCFGGMTHARACGYGQVSLLGRKRSPSEGTGGQLPDSRLGPICGSQGADVAPRRLPASQKSGANFRFVFILDCRVF